MANKKGTTIVNAAPEVVAEIVATDTADLDQSIRLERAVEKAQIEIMDTVLQVGRMQNMDALSHLSARAAVEMYDRVVGARKHIGLPYRKPDGSVARVASAEEFCNVFLRRNYDSLRESRLNLALVGPQLYDQLEAQGLLQRDHWRALRNAERAGDERLQEALAAPDKAKLDRLLVVVDQLKAQGEKAEARIKELEDKGQARDRLLENRNKRIDELETDVERRARLTDHEREAEACADIDRASEKVCAVMVELAGAYARAEQLPYGERLMMVRRQALERVVADLLDLGHEFSVTLDIAGVLNAQYGPMPPKPGQEEPALTVVR